MFNTVSAEERMREASFKGLPILLARARVQVGYLGGRYVSFPTDPKGIFHSKPTTFSHIREHIDRLQSETFAPLRARQAEFDRLHPFKDPKLLFGYCRPTLSAEEEVTAKQVIALRKQIDEELQKLVTRSNAQVENLSAIGQAYDKFLDTGAAIKTRYPGDEELVDRLVGNRSYNDPFAEVIEARSSV